MSVPSWTYPPQKRRTCRGLRIRDHVPFKRAGSLWFHVSSLGSYLGAPDLGLSIVRIRKLSGEGLVAEKDRKRGARNGQIT